MDASDTKRFNENFVWFNQFFGDVKSLLDKIGKALSKADLSLPNKLFFYYPRYRDLPTLPPYYAMCLEGKEFALQIYAVLDLAMLEDQNDFEKDLSFIVVKHSRVDRRGWLDDYGLKVIRSPQEGQKKSQGVISGTISSGEGKGTQFHAFQVPLHSFVDSQNINETIKVEIVDRLRALPDW